MSDLVRRPCGQRLAGLSVELRTSLNGVQGCVLSPLQAEPNSDFGWFDARSLHELAQDRLVRCRGVGHRGYSRVRIAFKNCSWLGEKQRAEDELLRLGYPGRAE